MKTNSSQNAPKRQPFRLGQNELRFLELILRPDRVSIHSPLPDFISNTVKQDIWEKIQNAYSEGSCNI